MTDSQKLGLAFKTAQWNATANVKVTEEEFFTIQIDAMLDGFVSERAAWRTAQGVANFTAQPPDVQETILKQLGVPENP